MTSIAVLAVVALLPCFSRGQNLALNKPAFQSSTTLKGSASRAVDGNHLATLRGLSCTHTLARGNEWWAVDLGAERNVQYVRITNRVDCCADRLRNFNIGLTNTHPNVQAPAPGNYEVCANVNGALQAGESRYIECSGVGQYVVIQLIPQQYLTLCEVEVYGGENLALNKQAYQSSTQDGGEPGLAVDGINDPDFSGGSCTRTGNGGGEWWAVDLGNSSNIHSVRITNRADCCADELIDFRVVVSLDHPLNVTPETCSYEVCASVNEALVAGENKFILCHGYGRYLVIELLPQAHLTLCEVEVYREITV